MSGDPDGSTKDAVEALHGQILAAWNRGDAAGYAEQFTDNAIVVGFDGSEMHGRGQIAERNAVQLLLAIRDDSGWRAAAFQNTPARLDGRPEAVKAMTGELRAPRD
jgi:hypothetical protein